MTEFPPEGEIFPLSKANCFGSAFDHESGFKTETNI